MLLLHAGKSWLYSDPLSHETVLHILANVLDNSRGLVAQYELPGDLIALPVVTVRAANSRRDDLDEDVIVAWGEDGTLLDLELSCSHPHHRLVGCRKSCLIHTDYMATIRATLVNSRWF